MEEEKDESLEIVRRPVIKPPRPAPFVKKTKVTMKGKSIKFIKEVIVPGMQRKILNLEAEVKVLKAKVRNTKESNKERIKKAVWHTRYIMGKLRRKAYGVSQKKIRKKAEELYYDKVKIIRMHVSEYMDGISAFPIIMQWCKENEFDYRIFCIFILMNHYEWFTYEDARFYGYDTPETRIQIRKLLAAGLVEKIRGKKMSFIVNVKGKELIENFTKYYRQRINTMFIEFDKHYSKREGYSGARMPKKGTMKNMYAHQIKLESNGRQIN